MLSIVLILVILGFSNLISQPLTIHPPQMKLKHDVPLLVADLESDQEVKNFRTTHDTYRHLTQTPPPRSGLEDLNASGSGEFNENFLIDLKKLAGNQQVFIVDLRQESHGYLNGQPISWYGHKNAANEGLSVEKILERESMLLAKLAKKKTVLLHKIREKSEGAIKDTGLLKQIVEKVESEQELAHLYGINYIRIPVMDRCRPQDLQVDRFIEFVKTMPENAKLHFHCRAGNGRTTTFMVLYDIIKNADKLKLRDIIHRQGLIGFKNLYETPAATSWKFGPHVDRLLFIQAFYSYVKDPNGYTKQSWTSWAQKNL